MLDKVVVLVQFLVFSWSIFRETKIFPFSLSCSLLPHGMPLTVFALLKVDVFIFTCRIEERMQWRKIKAFAENPGLYSLGSVQLECPGFEQVWYHPCEISISNCREFLVKAGTSAWGARKAWVGSLSWVQKPEGHLGNWGKYWTETWKSQLSLHPQHKNIFYSSSDIETQWSTVL